MHHVTMSEGPSMNPSPRRVEPKAAATSRPIEGFSVTTSLMLIAEYGMRIADLKSTLL